MIALFLCCTDSLVMPEWASASLTFTSFDDVISVVRVDPKYLNWSTSPNTFPFIRILVGGFGLMLLTRILLFRSRFIFRKMQRFLQPFSELLQFFFAASQMTDIVSKRQVAKRSSSDGQGTDGSEVSNSSASDSELFSAHWPFCDCRRGVKVF